MWPTICLLFAFCTFASAQFQSCPPPNFESLPNFNVTEYARAPWYIQQQMPTRYLPLDEFYCVRANYTIVDEQNISVDNYANIGEVNGPSTGGLLCAYIADLSEASQIAVGPCPLPKRFYGPYWVLAAGPTHGNYEYAIVSGGPPTISTPNGCKNGDGTNGSGLWIFTRNQVASQKEINLLIKQVQLMGFDSSVLLPVAQEGCLYEDPM